MINNSFKLSAPINVGILTTNRCNLNCKHCMNEANYKNQGELPNEAIKKILDECKKYDVFFVEFNGGEFFVRDDCEELINYALSLGLKVGITTNGTLITDEWIKKYKNKIYIMRISLDSHIEKIHDEFRGSPGAFIKTVDNIIKLVENDYRVTILHTITKSNAKYIENFINMIDSLGVHGLHTTIMIPAGNATNIQNDVLTPEEHREFLLKYRSIKSKINKDSNLKILEESPQSFLLDERILDGDIKVKCGAAFTEIVVTNEGYVLPCAAFIAVATKYKIPELSINNNSIVDIYRNSNLMNKVRNINNFKGSCSNCMYLKNCGGGCRAAADIMTGDVNCADPMCWMD